MLSLGTIWRFPDDIASAWPQLLPGLTVTIFLISLARRNFFFITIGEKVIIKPYAGMFFPITSSAPLCRRQAVTPAHDARVLPARSHLPSAVAAPSFESLCAAL